MGCRLQGNMQAASRACGALCLEMCLQRAGVFVHPTSELHARFRMIPWVMQAVCSPWHETRTMMLACVRGCVATASYDARRGAPLVAWCCLFVGGGEREQGAGCLQARSGSLSANASRAYCSFSLLLACMMSPAPILPVCDSAPGAQHTCIWAAGARGAFGANTAHAGAALQAAPLAWPSPALGHSTKIVGLGWRGPSRCRRRWRRRPARPPRSRRHAAAVGKARH